MANNPAIVVAGAFVLAIAGAAAQAHPGPDGSAAAPAPASAARGSAAGDEEILAPPPTYQASDVTVDEHLGARIPLDAAFRTQDGKRVTLGEVMHGELPAILTFNYSDCPMLCSVQLNGLTAALPKVGELGPAPEAGKPDMVFRVGAQFRIVTIDLEPNETLEKWWRGDYANITTVVDLTLSRLDAGLFTGTRWEGNLTELEMQWGRTIGQMPSPYTAGNPLVVPYHLDQGP